MSLLAERRAVPGAEPHPGMIFLPGGTFRMGSDRHYPEEAPAHRVTVDGFWMDRTPVTNRQFGGSCDATGHVTVAESRPTRRTIRRAAAHAVCRITGVHAARRILSTCATGAQWWRFMKGANWRRPNGPKSTSTGSTTIRSCTSPTRCDRLCRAGPARICRRKPNGNSRRAAGSTAPNIAWGDEFTPGGRHMANTWQGHFPTRISRGRLRADLAGHGLPAQRLRPLRHDRQCLGMDDRLVLAAA